ncbi:MAG: SpoIIE family protein phosphatase [Planctomycetota bacterium]
MALLRAIVGLQPGQLFPLEGDSLVMGRHPDCDIVLESGAVSRQHARVVREGEDFYIEDLKSRNGTYVNGEPIADRRLLKENDEVMICDLVFVFQQGPRQKMPSTVRGATDATAMFIDDDRPSGSTIMSTLDVSSQSAIVRLQANPEAKLKALLEISQTLGKALSLDQVLPSLLDGLFRIFVQADRGFVVLRDLHSNRLIPRAVKHRRPEDAEMVRISRTIIHNVINAKEAILSADALHDRRFEMAESIVDFHIRSMMCVPLVASDGQALGVIQIDTLDQRNRFSRDDLDVLTAVATQAAFAVENAQLHEAAVREQALARELAVAHRVQRGLLPGAPPQLADYRFFAFYEPAQVLGGDYYDYVPLRDGRVAVVVADVSGKGISASLLMAKLSAETRFSLAHEETPSDAVRRLNRVFCDSVWEDRFITLVVTVLDPERHEVSIVNAGHLPPLVRRAGGHVELVGDEQAQLPLGIADSVEFPAATVRLEPGECVVLYTDGITEAMNPADELYGFNRLLARMSGETAGVDQLSASILSDVKAFAAGRAQSDDMCLSSFGRLGDGPG